MEKYLTAKQIHYLYNLSPTTLLRWEKKGDLHPIKTTGGHRRYKESELLALLGFAQNMPRGGRCALYARVSTQKQADSGNLDRQLGRLKEIAKRRGYAVVAEYKEIASGSFSARLYGKRGGRVTKKLTSIIEKEVSANENDS